MSGGTESGKSAAGTRGFIIEGMDRIFSYSSLQGSIGAGKSTLLERLRHWVQAEGRDAQWGGHTVLDGRDLFLFVDEPVDEWKDPKYGTGRWGDTEEEMHSMIDTFYSDMEKYGLMFQINAFTTRLQRLVYEISRIRTDIPPETRIHLISERSLRTDRVFFRNLYEDRLVTNTEWKMYNDLYHIVTRNVIPHEKTIFYLNTTPGKCDRRIRERNRHGESDIPLSYLTSLDRHHKLMLEAFRTDEGGRVLELNMEQDMATSEIDIVADRIMNGIIRMT